MYFENGAISPFIRAVITRNVDGSIEAPKNIIQTVSAAYQQYTALYQDHIPRIAEYAAVYGMIAGNPPFDQDDLDANGLSHIANFNNFKARGEYKKVAQGYWNLINSTEVFTKIIINPNKYPSGLASRYASIMARHFSDVLKLWPDFQANFNLLGAQLTMYGYCPVIFPHEESPMWEVVDVCKFFIPSQTLSLLTKLTNFCVDTNYTVQQLYDIYSNINDKENSDWNKEALGDFLILRANNYMPTNGMTTPIATPMDLTRWVNNNDAVVNRYFNDNVRLTNMFQKEYTGKYSHYIFSPDFYQTTQRAQNTPQTDFLYFVNEQYSSLDEFMQIFTACPGEWTIHGNLGAGQEFFAPFQAINMLDCSIVDMSRMSATPIIKTLGTGIRDGSMIRFYPGVVTDIGSAELLQNNLGANINQLVVGSQYLTSGIRENTVNSGEDPGFPDRAQGSLSPSQARSKDFKEFGFLRNVVGHFYNTFDSTLRVTFLRFLTCPEGAPGYAYSKEFKDRCLEDGLPEELFDTAKKGLFGLPAQFRRVGAARIAGDGSTLARIMGLESLNPIMGTFNDREISAYKREYVEATMGVDYVDTFASDDGMQDEVTGGASLARAEDAIMALGKPALFSADNDQAAHADEHMGNLSALVQAVSQRQMSPVDADKILALALPHLTEHINFMLKSPQFYRETLNKLKEPFGQLQKWAALNRKNAQAMIQAAIEQQQKDAAATQQVMTDEQRKDFVAQRDAQRKDADVVAKNERADRANETRAEIMKEKAEDDAENTRYKIQLESQAKAGQTVKEAERDELLSKTPEELSRELATITGSTPSTVDFEPV